MTKEYILNTLKQLKPQYNQEGVILLGIFGSYAREEANEKSDIDILIETTPKFLNKYKGFKAFSKLDEIKEDLKKILKKDIDFVDKVGLVQHKNTHILESTLYVS